MEEWRKQNKVLNVTKYPNPIYYDESANCPDCGDMGDTGVPYYEFIQLSMPNNGDNKLLSM